MIEKADLRTFYFICFLTNAIDYARIDGRLLTRGEVVDRLNNFFYYYGTFGSGFEISGSTRTEDYERAIQKLDNEHLQWWRRSIGAAERESIERGIPIEFGMKFFYLLTDREAKNRGL